MKPLLILGLGIFLSQSLYAEAKKRFIIRGANINNQSVRAVGQGRGIKQKSIGSKRGMVIEATQEDAQRLADQMGATLEEEVEFRLIKPVSPTNLDTMDE